MNEEKKNMKVSFMKKSKDSDIARFRQKKLREIYDCPIFGEYEVCEIEDARKKLLSYKSNNMIRVDWKYREDIQYLYGLMTGQKKIDSTILENFDVLQDSYHTILMKDDTIKLEEMHVDLVEAVHEWAYRYRFEASSIKKDNATVWKNIILSMTNKLKTMTYFYDTEFSKEQKIASC